MGKGYTFIGPGRSYGVAKSTISTILKNREAIKAADVAKGVKSLTNKRLPAVGKSGKYFNGFDS